ncbi:MAG: NAD(P)H-dependent glycerol-3-phosphate dehydrogenase [Microbacteriaceae bacterium]|nr:NAD(P)H-dependent glycerol-3-phosphate dehydrogenase [Microbacteriaceae bacterium]
MRNQKIKAAVVGAGSWGTTFAKILCDAGTETVIWARRHEVADEINTSNRNSKYLQGINLPRDLRATSDLEEAVSGAQLVFLALPSQSMRENLLNIAPFLRDDAILVSLVKGVEKQTNRRMSLVISEALEWSLDQVAVVSGPNIALEIAKEQPTGAVASCSDENVAQLVAKAASASYFRMFTNTDVIGTELGGVLKNLIALAIGIVDGVGYGENTKASIITRGLAEMTDFAVASGAQPSTMIGLAGLGDLITTCQSPLSRNSTAGRLIGQGYSIEQTREAMNQVAEGISSIEPVLQLAAARDVQMPIVEQVKMVLEGKMKPRELAPHLATEDDVPKPEVEMIGGGRLGFFQRVRGLFGSSAEGKK